MAGSSSSDRLSSGKGPTVTSSRAPGLPGPATLEMLMNHGMAASTTSPAPGHRMPPARRSPRPLGCDRRFARTAAVDSVLATGHGFDLYGLIGACWDDWIVACSDP